MIFLTNLLTIWRAQRGKFDYYAYRNIRVDSQLVFIFFYFPNFFYRQCREAPRDDPKNRSRGASRRRLAKKHFFNIFSTFFQHFSIFFHHFEYFFNIFQQRREAPRDTDSFSIFDVSQNTDVVARRLATTQRAPKIGREAPRDDSKDA